MVESNFESLTKLCGGHLLGSPTSIYGPPKAGKSILLYQFCYDFLKSGNVLWFDTEGGALEMLTHWKRRFDQRYGVNNSIRAYTSDPTEKETLYLVECKSMKKILQLHGYQTELELTGGKESNPKINLRLLGTVENSIAKIVKRNNIRLVVYDSLSAPLRSAFAGGRLQFPARSDAVALWLGSILEMTEDSPIAVYISLHESYDPANPYAQPHMRGPMVVQYTSKVVFYLDPSRSTKPDLKSTRRLWLARFFDIEDWKRYIKLKLTDEGYVDLGVGEE